MASMSRVACRHLHLVDVACAAQGLGLRLLSVPHRALALRLLLPRTFRRRQSSTDGGPAAGGPAAGGPAAGGPAAGKDVLTHPLD